MFNKFKRMIPLAVLITSVLILLASCDSTATVDLDVTDNFTASSGYWTLNTDLALYTAVAWDLTSNPGALTMKGTPNSPSYAGMQGMLCSDFTSDAKYTFQVDARFATIPTSTNVNAMAKILICFNIVNSTSYDSLMIRSDGTWELRAYESLVELSPSNYPGYVAIDHATLPSAAFNISGFNTIKITQNSGTVGININGVDLATPTNWGMSRKTVGFGLGFQYGSALPATADGTAGPAVIFDNLSAKEFE